MAEITAAGGVMSILRRWLKPAAGGTAATQAEAAGLRAEYDRIFAQMGRSEFERVLSQRHADTATAYAHEVRVESDQLRAALEAMTLARAEAEGLATRHQAEAAAHLAARHAAETAATTARAEAEAADAARLAAELRVTRADRTTAGLRAEVAQLSAARNAAEKARNLAQEAAMTQHGELIRLRAMTGYVPEAPPLLGDDAPQPPAVLPAPFDEAWYLETYGDVKAAVAAEIFPSGQDHYIQHGRAEGRQSKP